jgi:hypothetical protein
MCHLASFDIHPGLKASSCDTSRTVKMQANCPCVKQMASRLKG